MAQNFLANQLLDFFKSPFSLGAPFPPGSFVEKFM